MATSGDFSWPHARTLTWPRTALWAGGVRSVLFVLWAAPLGQEMLFPLNGVTVVMATGGHTIYGAVLGGLANVRSLPNGDTEGIITSHSTGTEVNTPSRF